MFQKVKVFSLILILIITLCVTGCLTTGLGPKFTQAITPAPGKAIIYVYRQQGVMTAGTIPGIKINNSVGVKKLFEVSYFSLSVEPGQYTFAPKLFGIYKTNEATIDAVSGQIYFVRLKVSVGHLQFEQMNKDEAMAYMATCYLLDPKYSIDPRVVTGQQESISGTTTNITKEIKTEAITEVSEPVEIAKEKKIVSKTKDIIPEHSKPVLEEAQGRQARLYIDSNPINAKIRIMNISPVFEQGIKLDVGRYDVEVSAPGYLTYHEWTTLKAGEERRLQVFLKPEQKEISLPEKSPVQEQKIAPVVRTAKKIDTPAGVSAEEQRYAIMLQSGTLTDIRNAAKNIFRRYQNSNYLASVAEQALLKNYNKGRTDNLHIDTMAWLCKVLGQTGDPSFSETLNTIAQNAPHRKLRGYASKSLAQL